MAIKISKGEKTAHSRIVNIFAFGNTGVGKSTLLAAMIDYFRRSEDALLVFNQRNEIGAKAMMDWLYRLKENQFPAISTVGEIIEIEIGVIGIDNQLKYTFKLYEMSGEDLKEIEMRHEGKLDIEFSQALENSDVILTLAPREEIEEHEMLISQFYNYLYNKRICKPVCIVVTKWDERDEKEGNTLNISNDNLLKELVETQLAWPCKFLKVNGIFDSPMAFYFSIGKVVEISTEDHTESKSIKKIETYEPIGIGEISEWILEVSRDKYTK